MTRDDPSLRVLHVAAGPRDLSGERKFVRWFAHLFSQDCDLIYGAFEFEVVLKGALEMYQEEDLPDLAREVDDLLSEVRESASSEAESLEVYWFSLGAQWWPADLALLEGLGRVKAAISERLSR
jgi:hypothetical protein